MVTVKQVPMTNRVALLEQVTRMVESNLIILMPDERGNYAGVHADSQITVRLTRSKAATYKVGVFSPEGHTWVTILGGTSDWKYWDRLHDLACTQQEEIMAKRLTALAEKAIRLESKVVDIRDQRSRA
jgi:hypothetical protein